VNSFISAPITQFSINFRLHWLMQVNGKINNLSKLNDYNYNNKFRDPEHSCSMLNTDHYSSGSRSLIAEVPSSNPGQDVRQLDKNFRRMASSVMLYRVALVRSDFSEELSASFIAMRGIGELGTTLAITSNRRTLRRNTNSCHPDEGGGKYLRNVRSYKSQMA
jgi:hypothetical protein